MIEETYPTRSKRQVEILILVLVLFELLMLHFAVIGLTKGNSEERILAIILLVICCAGIATIWRSILIRANQTGIVTLTDDRLVIKSRHQAKEIIFADVANIDRTRGGSLVFRDKNRNELGELFEGITIHREVLKRFGLKE